MNPAAFNTYLYESIMFYDGARVYNQIQDYKNDPSWAPCAHLLAAVYYPYISSGSFYGLTMFPEGLMMDAQRTGAGVPMRESRYWDKLRRGLMATRCI